MPISCIEITAKRPQLVPVCGADCSQVPLERNDLSAAALRAKALRARLHAINILDQEAAKNLSEYADELEAQAVELDDDPHR